MVSRNPKKLTHITCPHDIVGIVPYSQPLPWAPLSSREQVIEYGRNRAPATSGKTMRFGEDAGGSSEGLPNSKRMQENSSFWCSKKAWGSRFQQCPNNCWERFQVTSMVAYSMTFRCNLLNCVQHYNLQDEKNKGQKAQPRLFSILVKRLNGGRIMVSWKTMRLETVSWMKGEGGRGWGTAGFGTLPPEIVRRCCPGHCTWSIHFCLLCFSLKKRETLLSLSISLLRKEPQQTRTYDAAEKWRSF